jgi:hypothetical protein
MSSNSTDTEVFVYTGEVGAVVPQDVVRVLVDPSVTSIPDNAFQIRRKLAEVELCEGLVEIGKESFAHCDHSISKITIPTSLRRICRRAFSFSLRTPIRLHDGIESIGEAAFTHCIFTNFRVPPLITVIPNNTLSNCKALFSLELTKNISEIKGWALTFCYCLRNVAFPPNVFFGDDIFIEEDYDEMTDLQRLFGNSNARIIRKLKHRFDRLPIHSIVYYQSYHQGVLQNLIAAINTRSGQRWTLCSMLSRRLRSKLDPTGNNQDCLGMTPLHILTCSSVHDLEMYRVIVENYPTNLVTEERWGALPLLYAFWGAAPADIIQFLLESYQSLHPGYIFNWTMMVETIGRTDTPKESIENLLCVKRMHFPEQPIDWEYLLDKFAEPSSFCFQSTFTERLQFLVMCGMSDRVEALALKVWREGVLKMIRATEFNHSFRSLNQNMVIDEYFDPSGNQNVISRIQATIAHF